MKLKSIMFSLCLLFGAVFFATTGYADSEQENSKAIWELIVHYKFESIGDDYSYESDPQMHAIWELRNEDLEKFLDFNQAFNLIQNEFNGPSVSTKDSKPNKFASLSYQRELVNMVGSSIYGVGETTEKKLSPDEINYISTLTQYIEDIESENGDKHFSEAYKNERNALIQFVDQTNAKLFTQLDEELITSYQRIQGSFNTSTSTQIKASSSCTTVYTDQPDVQINYSLAGTYGSSWNYHRDNPSGDCDIFVRYNGTSRMNLVDADSADAYCVAQKFGGAGAYLDSKYDGFNLHTQIVFGATRVESGWPIGCSTTGGAVQSGTDATP